MKGHCTTLFARNSTFRTTCKRVDPPKTSSKEGVESWHRTAEGNRKDERRGSNDRKIHLRTDERRVLSQGDDAAQNEWIGIAR